MKKPILLLIALCIHGIASSQIYKEFWDIRDTADSLFKIADYNGASDNYMKLFQLDTPKGGTDFYRFPSAQAYAMSNNLDAAFEQLFYITDGSKYKLVFYTPTKEDLINDSLLISLQKDSRWEKLLRILDERNDFVNAKLNQTLIKEIKEMKADDQKFRKGFYETRDKYGVDSKQVKKLYKGMLKMDMANSLRLEKIVDEFGWPGIDIIGFHPCGDLFFIIQHQNVEIQERYLPLIEEQFEKGNFLFGAYPMLLDRISMRNNHEQLYGTQSCYDYETKQYYICPISNPAQLNLRRYQLGEDSFEKAVLRSNEPWDVEEYKRNLPEQKAVYERDLLKGQAEK
jgi:hypothetical protein